MNDAAVPARGDVAAFDPLRIPREVFIPTQIAQHETPLPPPATPAYPPEWRSAFAWEPPAPPPEPDPPTFWDRVATAIGLHRTRVRRMPGISERALEKRISAALGGLCAYGHAKERGLSGPSIGETVAQATELVAMLRSKRLAKSELEDWLERFAGRPSSRQDEGPAPRGIELLPAFLLPAGIIALARTEPMLAYAGALRVGRGWSGEACEPALSLSAFGRWVGMARHEPLQFHAPGIGKAWGQAIAWTAISLQDVGDREFTGAFFAVCRKGALAELLEGREEGQAGLAGAVQAALWANWGVESYSGGIEALAALGSRATQAMPAAGLLLAMRFKREEIPVPWIVAAPGLERFETDLRRTLLAMEGAPPQTPE